MEKYVCRCGYVYDPADGDKQGGIAPGTAFDDLPASWVCPLCGLAKANFTKVTAGTITVAVKCFTTLVKAGACDYKDSTHYALPERSTVRDLIDKLQLPVEGIKLIFVNNIEVQPDTILNDGDQVGFSPAVGAM